MRWPIGHARGATPLEWASVAAEAAREFGAAKIVAEANEGGEMFRQTLLTVRVPCAVELCMPGRVNVCVPSLYLCSTGTDVSGIVDNSGISRRNWSPWALKVLQKRVRTGQMCLSGPCRL